MRGHAARLELDRLRRSAAVSPARRGALIYIAAGILFVATDSLTKSLVADLPVVHVVFGRHVSYLLAVLVFAGRGRPRRLFVTQRPWTQLARGVAMFGATATFFLALSLLPMAEVSALGSTTPLFVIALAGPLLGERIARSAVTGAIVGFGGVLILFGLDPAQLDPAMLVPLGTAVSFALFSMLTRALSSETAEVTVFLSGLVGLIAATALELAVPSTTMPTVGEWAAIGLVGVSALTAHRLLVEAFRWGRASDLAPLGYLSLVWSFLSGALVFGEAVQPRALLGALAIASGGIITLRSAPPRERGQQPAQPGAPTTRASADVR
ncbi:MAG TPA: DMT family transporter [Candidatus Limnocylindrales bacterium]|jgi:drug/metabolite transporter (DMT)-like permease|nr:DMT family transporter [Candidatus Limnocylindrales bacterium]